MQIQQNCCIGAFNFLIHIKSDLILPKLIYFFCGNTTMAIFKKRGINHPKAWRRTDRQMYLRKYVHTLTIILIINEGEKKYQKVKKKFKKSRFSCKGLCGLEPTKSPYQSKGRHPKVWVPLSNPPPPPPGLPRPK